MGKGDFLEKISIVLPLIIQSSNDFAHDFENLKNSLLKQSLGFENLEIILISDEFIDTNSKNLLHDFLNSHNNVKNVYLDGNDDEKSVFEIGLNNATTDYMMFFYPDSSLKEHSCKILYDEIFENNSDIVIGDSELFFNEDSRPFFNEDSGLFFNGDSDFHKKIPNKIIYSLNDKKDEFFYMDLVLSSRIYKKEFLLKIFNENGFNSWNHFNFLTLINARKIVLLNESVSIGKKFNEKKKLINLDKLKVLNKLFYKKYDDLTIAIKTPNPINEKFWGDYFFALSLKRSFEKKGFNVVIHEREFWEFSKDNEDIVIVLRGRKEYNPKPYHLNIMWNISHPNDISLAEFERYDYVFIASNKFANEIGDSINTIVKPLLQCTDPEIFYHLENDDFCEEILFVGITRDVFRTIVKDLSETSHHFSVYGRGWEEFIDKEYIKGEFIPNKILNQAYSSCKILLNDHWEDMKEKDFPSNRLFDALACGTFVISDEFDAAKTVFDGTVVTYKDSDDLQKKLDYYLSHDDERNLISKRGQNIVLKYHTFDNRVDEILETLENYDFNSYFKAIGNSLASLDCENESNLRVILIGYRQKDIDLAISNIKSISNEISISVLNLGDFSRNKFLLDHANFDLKKFVVDNLNDLVKNSSEDFILIMDSENVLDSKAIDDFFKEFNEGNLENVGAIVYDSDYNSDEEFLNYKLGFSPDLFLEFDYYDGSVILNRKSLLSIGSFDINCFNNLTRDIVLRFHKNNIGIIKKDLILQEINNNVKLSSFDENKILLNKILDGRRYDVSDNPFDDSAIPIYDSLDKKASIIIPFKDEAHTTELCVDSILEKTEYPNYEIILINNNSYEKETFYYIEKAKENDKVNVFDYDGSFNWSKINNFASEKSNGDVLVFLNNDTEVISKNWLSLLVSDAIQPNVGAVGSKLLYPDNAIQHLGVVMGLTYFAGHIFAKYAEDKVPNIFNVHRRNVSAVTGACIAIEKETFEKIGKFDENFEISFSDIEFCLRLMENGYRNIINPQSILYHHEMKSRGHSNFRDADKDIAYSYFKHYLDNGDPFFNKNLSLNSRYLVVKGENEVSDFSQYLQKFISQRKARQLSIQNAKSIASQNNGDGIVYSVSNHGLSSSEGSTVFELSDDGLSLDDWCSVYEKGNSDMELYNIHIDKDIFFPFEEEKLEKTTIVFNSININSNKYFDLGFEALKTLKIYYGDNIDIFILRPDFQLEYYDLNGLKIIGNVNSSLELANLYRRAHICLMFSSETNSYNGFLECIACGCVLITNHDETSNSFIKNKENSIITELDLDSLVENMIDLIDNYGLYHNILCSGLNLVRNLKP